MVYAFATRKSPGLPIDVFQISPFNLDGQPGVLLLWCHMRVIICRNIACPFYNHVEGQPRSDSLLKLLLGYYIVRGTMSSLSELAEQLLVQVRKLESYTTANKIPSASFQTDVFRDLPAELQESRSAAVDISQTIRKLTLGPEGIATDILFSVSPSSRKHVTIFPQIKVFSR